MSGLRGAPRFSDWVYEASSGASAGASLRRNGEMSVRWFSVMVPPSPTPFGKKPTLSMPETTLAPLARNHLHWLTLHVPELLPCRRRCFAALSAISEGTHGQYNHAYRP